MSVSNPRGAGFLLLTLSLLSMGFSLSPDASRAVRELAIQHNGRVKPFDTFARETLRWITGSARIGSEDPVETVLSILADPEPWADRPLLAVPFGPLREQLGLDRKATHLSYNQLVEMRRLMRMLPAIVRKQSEGEKLSMLEQETMDLYDRFVSLSNLFTQRLHLVPGPGGEGASWVLILEPTGYRPDQQAAFQERWATFLASVKEGRPEAVEESARALASVLQAANRSATPASWRLRLEVLYNRANPFKWVQLFYGVAAIGLAVGLVSGWRIPFSLGMASLSMGFLLHGAGIGTRVVLGSRPPVSNFYETMLWLPFVAVGLALLFERIYRAGSFALAASILGGIVLALADLLPLEPYLSPVVAVLRSNLWLTVHVLTIVASYGALTLAVGLAHLYGGLLLVRGQQAPALNSLGTFLYRAIQVGVILLASGIMLGGVWANASWGRYWGWDPKETWALITLLWFLAVLHGRFAGWLKDAAVAMATIGGFFLLLMTYYGVSFYLVGLHSYAGGHAKPVPPLLIAYLIAELGFISLVGWATLRPERSRGTTGVAP